MDSNLIKKEIAMNKLSTTILYQIILLLFVSCHDDTKTTMRIAEDNCVELQKVIDSYRVSSLKQKAACFIIANMAGHYTTYSAGIDSFVIQINKADTIIGTGQLKQIWNKMRKYDIAQIKKLDAQTLDADYLTYNIDAAYNVWIHSPWRKDVPFDFFCRYILPYRIEHEQLPPIGWRDSIYNKYYPIIKGVTDIKEAYSRVYNHLLKKMLIKPIGFPYLLNVLSMEHINKGTCLQRSIYIATVMRALGIPCAVEIIDHWANYSTVGHSWVCLITKEGLFTVAERDSIAKKDNPIDASTFFVNVRPQMDFQYNADFKKRCAKVWRLSFEINTSDFNDINADEQVANMFINPYVKDVSCEYNLIKAITISSNEKNRYCYLCTYVTNIGWLPVAWAKKTCSGYSFTDIGDSIVYLPAVYDNGRMKSISAPFVLQGGEKHFFKITGKETIKVSRKYPLIGTYIKNWAELKDGRFEGSNDAKFATKDTLYMVKNIPSFRNVIRLKGEVSYRYIKYVSPQKRRSPLTEIEIWSEDKKLTGRPFSLNTNGAERCFDGNTFTTLIKQQTGYIVGLDLMQPTVIDSIVFFSKNDGNFVVPNDAYELFYYDMKWNSLGSQKSKGYEIEFTDVPKNALLMLKNKTKGREERIFTYQNGEQIWW